MQRCRLCIYDANKPVSVSVSVSVFRRKGWAAAGPQRPAYSGRELIVSPRAQLVLSVRPYVQCSYPVETIAHIVNFSQCLARLSLWDFELRRRYIPIDPLVGAVRSYVLEVGIFFGNFRPQWPFISVKLTVFSVTVRNTVTRHFPVRVRVYDVDFSVITQFQLQLLLVLTGILLIPKGFPFPLLVCAVNQPYRKPTTLDRQ